MAAGAALLIAAPALARAGIRAVGWAGTARLYEGATPLDLTVRTRVEPFRRARSTSWITAKGETTARTLVIEPDDGWMERGGERRPLPPALIAHERQQYGVYGYLLGRAPSHRTGSTVRAAERGFPPIRMELTDGRVTAADYTVGSAEDGRPLPQHFTFDGAIDRGGVRWFRRMTMFHAGARYFELMLADVVVERG